MFIILAILTGISAITMFMAGLLSFLRDSSKNENRWFFALSAALAIWVPANFYDSNLTNIAIVRPLIKIDFIASLFIGWGLLMFVAAYVKRLRLEKKVNKFMGFVSWRYFILYSTLSNIVVVALIFAGKLFSVSIDHEKLALEQKDLFGVYVALLVGYFLYALLILGAAYFKSTKAKRRGIDLVWIGFFIAFIANIATNLVFPSLIEERATVKALNIIGYIGILTLVACLYVAITTRKLFEIRLVVARSLAYVIVLAVIGVFYALLSTLLSYLLSGARVDTALLILNLSLTFFTAITFQYIHNYFKKITARLLFKENYDPQTVLDDLNSVITSTLDINTLINNSIFVLQGAVKSSFCAVVLDGSENRKIFSMPQSATQLHKITDEIESKLNPHTPLQTENFEDDHHIYSVLQAEKIELIIPLYVNMGFIGYAAFAVKNNGVAYTQQDISLLTIAADSLSVAIQNALRFEEIEEFNETLQQRINDATVRLKRTNEKLKALDETKDEFISMASHQLRTPLTSVKGYVSMVLEEDAGKLNQQQHDLLTQAFTSSQRMVYLIADLLNVSRLRTGKFVIENSPTSLVEVVESEITQLHEQAKSKKLVFEFKKPKKITKLMLDETKIRQVIMNFIDNSLYYTPAGGHITVELKEDRSNVYFTVKDNGLGVPKDEQKHLFTKFFRAKNARQARPDGTGLGLFMAKKVITAQGGSLLFESEEGKGSTFGFTFDKAKHLPKE